MSDLDLAPLHAMMAEFTPKGRAALLPALQNAQTLYKYIPEEVACEVGRLLQVPLADVQGVIDFYSLLYSQPVGKTILRVCSDPSCALAGGDEVLSGLCRHLGIETGELSADGNYTIESAPCLGLCEHAPAVLANDTPYVRVNPSRPEEILDGEPANHYGLVGGDTHLLISLCGLGHAASLEEYLECDGYAGLKKALEMSPQQVIGEVKASGLVGRGGAAFPTGIKWEGTANASGLPKYVVCNADESEPGTLKDRVLLEEDPHRMIEGLTIAAYAVGAHQGYVYLRGEYSYVYKILEHALEETRQAGFLGEDILGSGFSFEIEMRLGAGAYICGEETALFESIEGKRGFPRIKPPYPTTSGLFGKPTAINNVETLYNVPLILDIGAPAYREIGTEKSPGPKLFCVTGDVNHPGLYEAPFGVTLRHLLNDLAGGVRNGHSLQAALIGGAAGTFATEEHLDVKLSFEDLRAAGLPLGSGVITVFDETRDMRDALLRLGRFFAHESCGKCFPCQLGTQRQYEILQRVATGEALPGDAERLADIGWTMSDSSICGLGQTAATAVLSAMKLWPGLFSISNQT
jgi:NADH-quinone oxidoreductase subunit F